MSNPWTDLKGALAGLPILENAACKTDPHIWDAEDDQDPRYPKAVAGCASCPALNDCRRWLDGLDPTQYPSGVVAGRIVTPAETRPPSQTELATEWLRDYLRRRGPSPVKAVTEAARVAGFSRDLLAEARKRLGVAIPIPGPCASVWHLPDQFAAAKAAGLIKPPKRPRRKNPQPQPPETGAS